MAAAQVSATQAKADYERFKDLQAQGFISAAELERRSSTWKAADAQLAQARAQADVQINQSGYSRLLAPAAGVVTAVDAEPGTVLATGATVLRLAHAGPRDVVFAVPEDTVDGLRALRGKPGLLTVKLWGRPEAAEGHACARWPLRPTRRPAPSWSRPTWATRASTSGQTASVSLPLPVLDGLMRLPLSALLQQNNRTVVWVLDPAR